MPFVIEHGKISTMAPLALQAGQASWKRMLQNQQFEMGRMAAQQSFARSQQDRAYAQAERSADTQFNRTKELGDLQFGRQKEMVGYQNELRSQEAQTTYDRDLERHKELMRLNEESRASMEQKQYDLNQKRRLAELDKFSTYLDGLESDKRYDPQELLAPRMELEAERANIHMKAIPKPQINAQEEIAKRMGYFDMGDGTKQQFYLDKDDVPRPVKDTAVNREAVFGKIQADIWKSPSGRLDGDGNPLPLTEEEFNNRLDITMRARDRFLGKTQPAQGAPANPQDAQAAELIQAGGNAARRWLGQNPTEQQPQAQPQGRMMDSTELGTPTPEQMPQVIEQFKGALKVMPPEVKKSLEEERDRLLEQIKWAKNTGSGVILQKAKDDLRALLAQFSGGQQAVPPPMAPQ